MDSALTLPLTYEPLPALRFRRGASGGRVELVPPGQGRRSPLTVSLERRLVLRWDGVEGAARLTHGRVPFPADARRVSVSLDAYPIASLALDGDLRLAGPAYRLSPFEARFLAENGHPHAIPDLASPAGEAPRTDLHTHFAGCVSAPDLVQLGVELDLGYPARSLAAIGVTVAPLGEVALRDLPESARARLIAALDLPLDRQVPFATLSRLYRLRAPLTKHPAAFVPLLERIAADYRALGVCYAELSLFDILDDARIRQAHAALPAIEEASGVTLRFLAALSRHDDREWDLDCLDRIAQLARSRYLAGVDFMGHETNSTRRFAPLLRRLSDWARGARPGFVVRVHAGENPAHPENVRVAAESVDGAAVRLRVGHGLYGGDAATLDALRQAGAIVELNLNSNFALNNLQSAAEAPLARYLDAGLGVVLGTDGYGIYRSGPAQELQAARLCGLDAAGLERIRDTEAQYLEERRAHEAGATDAPEAFRPPAPHPPFHYTPAVEARKRADAQARDATLTARLDALGVPALSPAEAAHYLRGHLVLSFAGAWAKSWTRLSPHWQAHVEREVDALLGALDPARTRVVTGGTTLGLEGVVNAAARRHGHAVLGVLVWGTPPDSIAPDALARACIGGVSLYDKAAQLYRLLREGTALCLFIGGGNIVNDEIQTAANLKLRYLLMDGPEGASTHHARLQPDRAFRTAADVLRHLDAAPVWCSTPEPYWHVGANPTVDVAAFRGDEILLVRRASDASAEPGKWALPGGFQHTDAPRGAHWLPGRESAAAASLRELWEETGLDLRAREAELVPVGVYAGGGRDPRDGDTAWSRAHVFAITLTPDEAAAPLVAGDDAAEARWWPLDALPHPLAFDHGRLLADAQARA